MVHIALLGFGTVGGGVAGVIDTNRKLIEEKLGDQIDIRYILDLREFPGNKYEKRIVHTIDPILADPEVSVVAEMMGGVHPAADFTRMALEAGKSVVTSNKAVVADCGDELLALAKAKGVRYLFEASVGGGIPVLHPLVYDLADNEIVKIRGILNGTTNYILTEMTEKGAAYADVLKEAQKLGYAEADPTADVEGFDAARKIVILAALAWGKLATLEDVSIRGISAVTAEDIAAAKAEGCRIKLIGEAEKDENGKIVLSVSPRKVPLSALLASVNGVFNAVQITGNMLGDAVFYGRGAGRDATASAVVADILDAAERKAVYPPRMCWKKAAAGDFAKAQDKYLSVCE